MIIPPHPPKSLSWCWIPFFKSPPLFKIFRHLFFFYFTLDLARHISNLPVIHNHIYIYMYVVHVNPASKQIHLLQLTLTNPPSQKPSAIQTSTDDYITSEALWPQERFRIKSHYCPHKILLTRSPTHLLTYFHSRTMHVLLYTVIITLTDSSTTTVIARSYSLLLLWATPSLIIPMIDFTRHIPHLIITHS